MSSLSATIQDVFNEPGCGKNANKSEAERKKGCTKQLAARRRGGRLRLRRRQDRAAADHRCRPSRARPDRLRGQLLGQSRREILRLESLAHRLHHRHQRDRRRLRRREAALQGHQGDHREIRSAGGLRLSDLRARDDRRRYRRGLQGGEREIRQAGHSGQLAGLRRAEKPRQQARRRSAARARDRHGRAGIHHALRPQHHRRIQSRRRIVAGQAAARRTRHPHSRLHLRRRQISRSGLLAPRRGGDDGLLQGDDQRRAQDGGALRHPLLRRLVLRHRRYQRLAARDRAPA